MKKIRIGINARVLQERMSGIPRFTLNLIEGLAKLEKNCEIHLFFLKRLFAETSIKKRLAENPSIVQHYSWWSGHSYLSRMLWDLIFLGFEAKRYSLHLFFGPAFTAPLFISCPTVVMIYDLVLQHAPNFSRRPSSLLFRLFQLRILIPLLIRRAQVIVTCSEGSRQDLMREYNIRKKIHVIPGGVEEKFQRIEDKDLIEEVLNRLKIHQPYILNPSGPIPRKNQLLLIEAFARLQVSNKGNYQLVIVGPGGDTSYIRQVKQRIRALGLGGRVLMRFFVSDQDLVALYNGAALCVYPSLYEGFGFPLLEAMACGTPVIASNTSSLPGLVEDAGLLVSPQDPEAWAQSMHSLLAQKDLRHQMVKRGLRRREKFTWHHTAEKFASILLNLLETEDIRFEGE